MRCEQSGPQVKVKNGSPIGWGLGVTVRRLPCIGALELKQWWDTARGVWWGVECEYCADENSSSSAKYRFTWVGNVPGKSTADVEGGRMQRYLREVRATNLRIQV